MALLLAEPLQPVADTVALLEGLSALVGALERVKLRVLSDDKVG